MGYSDVLESNVIEPTSRENPLSWIMAVFIPTNGTVVIHFEFIVDKLTKIDLPHITYHTFVLFAKATS